MATLYHQVWIDASAARVYEALATADGLGRRGRHIHPPKQTLASYWRTTRVQSMASVNQADRS